MDWLKRIRRKAINPVVAVEPVAVMPARHCVHHMLDVMAESHPAAMAMEDWSYGALQVRANQVAHLLRASGVRPGMLVGLCLERTADLPLALWAVLKAGARWVLMDPHQPRNVLARRMDEAYPHMVVSHRRLDYLLPRHAMRVVRLDQEFYRINAQPMEPVMDLTRPDHGAAVIFRHGKPVEVTHAELLGWLNAMRDGCGITPEDRLLSATGWGLDVLLALLCGSHLCLAGAEADIFEVGARLGAQRITVMHAPTPVWQQLMETEWPGWASLKALHSGEDFPPHLAEYLARRVGALWHLQGGTIRRVRVEGLQPACGTSQPRAMDAQPA